MMCFRPTFWPSKNSRKFCQFLQGSASRSALDKVEPEYARAVARDQAPVRRIVIVSNGYLREIYNPRFGHTFTVYVEPLVGNRTNFRNNGDHYAIVIGAGPQFPIAEVQHAYLHFLLDRCR